ncbi:uncharacterized protein A1O5_05954 [Cladophialophora psammophila CBS 110553]|uniref:Rhodanese domain-containing protein n=1 Tax=Cladophialophora psammophila CBS 110553 TaxID=1182543 RepID=W9X213_9EURO|nr:uncharacterized protein A1O5_05954 [Cladophialophora psammophila CBS 110553]EXJ70961.1 hypothetical protein A1O5_05954 [Cladophialophora psammophila CBS 110553]
MASKQAASSLQQCLRTFWASRRATCSYRTVRRSPQHSRLASTQSQSFFYRSGACALWMPRLRQPTRHFTTTLVARKDESSSPSSSSTSAPEPQSRLYTFTDMQFVASSPDPNRIIIDVREPSELKSTGKIPGSRNLPIKSAADGFFLGPEEFEERFGWEKPSQDDEVIFYCKAGVRSQAAARLAGQADFGGKIGEFPGSWSEWAEKGGEVESVD